METLISACLADFGTPVPAVILTAHSGRDGHGQHSLVRKEPEKLSGLMGRG
jgi:hypothetical protein